MKFLHVFACLVALLIGAFSPVKGDFRDSILLGIVIEQEVSIDEQMQKLTVSLNNSLDSAERIAFLEELFDLAKQEESKATKARYYFASGWFYKHLIENYAIAVKCFDLSFIAAEQSQQRSLMASAMLQAMETFVDLGLYQEALEYLFKAESVFQKYNYEGFRSVTNSLFRIGQFFYRAGNHDQSIQYFEKALVFNDLHDDDYSMMVAHNTLGLSYLQSNQYLQAIEVFQIANQMARELGDKAWEALTYGNIGMVYAKTNEYEQAITHLNYDLSRSIELEGWASACNASVLLAQIYYDLENYEQARIFIDQAEMLELKADQLVLKVNISEFKAKILYQTGAYQVAYDYLLKNKQWTKAYVEGKRLDEIENARKRHLYELQLQNLVNQEAETEISSTNDLINRLISVLMVLLFLVTTALYVLLRRERKLKEINQSAYDLGMLKREMAALKKQFELYADLQQSESERQQPTVEMWEQLRVLMNQRFDLFFSRLKSGFPELKPEDIQALALLKLQMEDRRVAELLGYSSLQWQKWLQEVKPKLGLSQHEELINHINSL